MLQAFVPKTRGKVGRCLRHKLVGVLLTGNVVSFSAVHTADMDSLGSKWMEVLGII
jgi:hypothetical protein